MTRQCIIYCRKSTTKDKQISLLNQSKKCHAYCRKNGIKKLKKAHKETGSGWRFRNGTSLNDIARNLKRGNCLVISCVDRLTRDYKMGLRYAQSLKRKGVDIISVDENISFIKNEGEFRELLMDAQMSSDNKSRSQLAIARINRLRGYCMGHAPFGYEFYYNYRRVRKLRKCEQEQFIIEYIVEWLKDGLKYKSIVSILNYHNMLNRNKIWDVRSLGHVVLSLRKLYS